MKPQDQDLVKLEQKLLEKEERLDKEKERLEKEKLELAKIKEEYREKLSKSSGLSSDEAKKELLRETEEKESQAVARIIKEKEDIARKTADKKSQENSSRQHASWRIKLYCRIYGING